MNLTCPNCGARFKIKNDALGTKGRKVKCGKCEHRWYAMPEADPAAATPAAPVAVPADPTEDFVPPPPPPPPVADPTEAPPPPPPPAAQAAEDDVDDDDFVEDDVDVAGVPDEMLSDPPPIPPESTFAPRNRAPEPKPGGMLKYWVLLLLLLIGGSSAAFVWRDTVVHHFPVANKVFMMAGFPANTLGYGLKIYEPKTHLDVKDGKRILGVTGQIMNETGKVIEIPLLKAVLIGAKGEDISSWTFDAKDARILPGEKIDYETVTENPPRGATGLRITFTLADEEAMGDKVAPKEKGQ